MKALVVKSGGRDEHGVSKVVLDKDEHGDVGPAGHTVGEFDLDDTHASASETLDTYSHLWPDNDERTRAAVDGVLRNICGLFADQRR